MTRVMRKTETVMNLAPPKDGKPYVVADSVISNLYVRVGLKRKKFVITARFGRSPNPATRVMGDASTMTIEEARTIAIHWNELISKGVDPAIHQQNEIARRKKIDRQTFGRALEDYSCWLPMRLRNRKAKDEQRYIRTELLDPRKNRFLGKPVCEITGADVQLLVESIRDRGVRTLARGVYTILKTFFNWLLVPLRAEAYCMTHSPCASLKPSAMQLKSNERDRYLSSQEIRAYCAAAEETPSPWREFQEALLFCGQRSTETATARWQDIDFEARLWTIPAGVFKSNREQVVPLTIPMMRLLERIKSRLPIRHGPYIFSTGDGHKPISGLSNAARAFRRLMKKKFEELYPNSQQYDPWVNHDLRRTVRTGLTNLGVPPEVAEAVIGHEQKKLEKTYNTSKFKAQKRRALYLWSEEIRRILDEPGYDYEGEDSDEKQWPSRWNTAEQPEGAK